MSDNDCCGMFLTCCMCCSLCSHSSDSAAIRWFVGLFPDRWCGKLDDTAFAESTMRERDREAELFEGRNTEQPESVPGMDVKAGGPTIRDKSHILSDE